VLSARVVAHCSRAVALLAHCRARVHVSFARCLRVVAIPSGVRVARRVSVQLALL
jgi:hypothetical protein